MDGNTPEILNILAKSQDILLFRSLIILTGTLLLNEGKHFDISSLAIGAIINDSKLLGGSKHSTELLESLIFP